MSDLMSEQQSIVALAWLDLSYILGLLLIKTIVLFQRVIVIFTFSIPLPSILHCTNTTSSVEFSWPWRYSIVYISVFWSWTASVKLNKLSPINLRQQLWLFR